ncbi:hypothetical protein LEP1GSC016_1726 [Leptospira borgpetersenii serovar Hardjo-bovis str. Sponselee]|uniref:Uncharacterized protein n=1 Tax=Leptospira borgpetersenii serovar Hardjo-bovis str. Sponselee TaxID=1303729 RepID=M6BJJ6_LEPBO|nr:hypothetical protein LEP1GSC016_1726 [Leptospira borgpetersenii serovar Hardjo-bovis str. Sponselee]
MGSPRFSFLLCQKDQAARFCPSFGTEPYIEFTLLLQNKYALSQYGFFLFFLLRLQTTC